MYDRGLAPDFRWGAATSAYQIEGAVDRGWSLALHLGHLLPGSRRDRQRRHRRRGVRPLPPLPRGHRVDEAPRPRLLPVLDRVAPGAARAAPARSNAAGLDFYDRLVDGLLDAGIDPVRDALPLGSAAGAAGPRRLAGRDTAYAFAEMRRRDGRRASATGSPTGSPSTSRCARPGSGTSKARWRPGIKRPGPGRTRVASSASRTWPGGGGRAGRRAAPIRIGAVLNLSPCEPASDDPARHRGGPARRRPHQPLVARPAARSRLPAGHDRGVRHRAAGPATATWTSSRRRWSTSASTTTSARSSPTTRPARRRARRWSACPTGRSPRWAGRSTPTAWSSCWSGCTEEYGATRIYVTENGSAWPDEIEPDGNVEDKDRIDYLEQHLDACGRAADRRVRRWPATSPGRCWTTSSGPTATPSGSAWCTSTTRPSAAPSRPAATATRTSSATTTSGTFDRSDRRLSAAIKRHRKGRARGPLTRPFRAG